MVRLHRRRRNKRDADIREWDTAQPKRHGVSKGGIAGKRNNSVVGEVSCTDRVYLVLLPVTLDGSTGKAHDVLHRSVVRRVDCMVCTSPLRASLGSKMGFWCLAWLGIEVPVFKDNS